MNYVLFYHVECLEKKICAAKTRVRDATETSSLKQIPKHNQTNYKSKGKKDSLYFYKLAHYNFSM